MTALLARPSFDRSPDRRFAALAVTALVHVLLVLGWQATRRLPAPGVERDTRRIQWITLTPPAPVERRPVTPAPPPERTRAPERVRAHAPAPVRLLPAPAAVIPPVVQAVPATPIAPGAAGTPAPSAQPAQPAQPGATASAAPGPLLQRALREAGAVDRALRKENNPYIVAPPDSPQIRLRRGIAAANELAPPAWYEAPKVAELVNNTGDGARRTRVITGGGTYCITDRGANTSIDMIETHGKQRITSCPAHESAASNQEWKTARDP